MRPAGMFVDRKEELETLLRLHNEEKAHLVILYGRRRIGKTSLLQKFIQQVPRSIFFMSDASENILDTFSGIASSKFSFARFSSWNDFFDFLDSISSEERMVVVIDEFQYLYQVNKAWPTILQRHWEKLKNSKILLILSGSMISSIFKISLGYGSALYGRKTAELRVRPLTFLNSMEFFNRFGREDRLRLFMITGGVPRYMEEFDRDRFALNIKEKLMDKNSFLYNEPLNIMNEEFKDFSSYFSVISAVASGASTFGEISSKSRIAESKLSKVIGVLERAQIIVSEESVIPNNVRKKHVYFIQDNFFAFWFRFIYPNRSFLELGNTDTAYKAFQAEEKTFFGHRFEGICRELILSRIKEIPFPVQKIGRAWGKMPQIVEGRNSYEFDLVLSDQYMTNLAIFEIRYKALTGREAENAIIRNRQIFQALNLKNVNAIFGVVALSVKNRTGIPYVYELDDFL